MFPLALSLGGLVALSIVHHRTQAQKDIPLREVWKISGYWADGNLNACKK